jgi:hypothetical protein
MAPVSSPLNVSKMPSIPRFGMSTVADSEQRCFRITNPDLYVSQRAIQLAEAIYARFAENKYYTLAVGVAVDKRGCCHKLISTSNKSSRQFYVPPEIMTLAPPRFDEIPVPTHSHAEQNIVFFAKERGWLLKSIGATRRVCPACVAAISLFGIRSITVEKLPDGVKELEPD